MNAQPSRALGSFFSNAMNRPRVSILLATITLLAFALRAFHLDFQPLWNDEGYSIFFATRDFATMLDRTAVDIHPPLYYALLQLWIMFIGKSDIATRWFSVIIGTATIPLMYALALVIASGAKQSPNRDSGTALRKSLLAITQERVAFLAALLLTLSPLHIYYSQEVRMYGLVTLLCLVSVYLFIRLLAMQPGKPKTALVALAYILITAAALYTQYYAVFIIIFEIAVWLVTLIQNSKFEIRSSYRAIRVLNFELRITNYEFVLHWFAAWSAIAVLYLPWVIYAGSKLLAYVTSKVAIEKYAPLDPIAFLTQHLAAFSVGHLTTWSSLVWASVLPIAIAVWGFIAEARRRRGVEAQSPSLSRSPALLPAHVLGTTCLAVPLALGYLVNLFYPFHPIHSERLLLFAAPAFYLLIALGINALWNHRAILGALAMIIVAIISAFSLADFYNIPRYPKDDYRPLIAEMQTLAQPGDLFLAIYPWQIGYLEAYYTGAPLNIVELTSNNWQPTIDNCQLSVAGCRMWLPALQTQGRILEDALDQYLRERAYSVLDNWHGTTRLELFAFAADPPLPRAPRNIVFEDDTILGDLGISREPVTAGQDIIRIRFVGEVRTSATASFRLLDKNGSVWAQSDREIVPGLQRIGFAIPVGTPPGEYDLRVLAYRASDNARLRVKESAQESASLATIQIIAPAQPNLAALPHRAQIDFENGMRLVGYDVPPNTRPGFATPLALFWQATRALDKEYTVILQVQDARSNVFAETQAAPARGIYPTTHWQPGEVVRDPQTITLRGNTPDGDYRLAVALVDATTGTRTVSREIGTIVARGRAHYFGAPSPSNKSDAQLDDLARLVGYDLNYDQRTIRLVLYWQVLATSEASYTVFVHVVDANETIRAQRDQIPGAGAYPTTTWIKGEYLVDVYDISIPRDAPPGEYAIRIGMYDAATGARLSAFDRNNLLGDYIQPPTRIIVR